MTLRNAAILQASITQEKPQSKENKPAPRLLLGAYFLFYSLLYTRKTFIKLPEFPTKKKTRPLYYSLLPIPIYYKEKKRKEGKEGRKKSGKGYTYLISIPSVRSCR